MIRFLPDSIQSLFVWLTNPWILAIVVLAAFVGLMWLFSWLSKKQ